MHVDWLIVGAGFTGATLAERIATQLDQSVLVIDKRDHIAGNAFDYYDEHGVMVHRYGPHIFHTNARHVWRYLSRFTEWRPYYHKVLGVVDGKKVPIPFNLNSLYSLFPPNYAQRLEAALIDHYGFGKKVPILRMKEADQADLVFLADYIYQNVFHNYTLKQWELEPDQLSPSVTGRVPVYISRDDRYFQDLYQAMPRLGYTEMFRRLLGHKNIRIMLQTDYREVMDEIQCDRVVYSGPIDEYFDYMHGPLPYRSLDFRLQTLDREQYQEVGTVNYPNEYDFTRITEQKTLTGQQLPKTTLVYEYPQAYVRGENDPYYPIPCDEHRQLYAKYAKEAEGVRGKVYFAGRLGDYKYYNMDQAVARALKVFDNIAGKGN